jgi:hypothetical protein
VKSFLADVADTYRDPAAVFARKLTIGVREPQLLAWVVFACLISFLARLPGLVSLHRESAIEQPLEALLAASLVAGVFFAPIFFYVLAGISHLVAKVFGKQGSWQSARVALFWSLIALQPLLILTQTLSVQIGTNLLTKGASIGAGAFFLWVWFKGMQVAGAHIKVKTA